jgi:hypothetical protein
MFEHPIRRTYELLMQQWQQWQRARENGIEIKVRRLCALCTRIISRAYFWTHSLIRIQQVFLVGGFSESPYMFAKLKEFIESDKGRKVIKPSYA